MSQLALLKKKGYLLPTVETVEGLTAQDLMDKILSFYRRFEKYDGESADFMEGYFLELLKDYPKSMCSRHMTETMKQLIALFYLESKPNREDDDKDAWQGFSYEDLAVMFDISKATVHEAIRHKEAEVKQLLAESELRVKAKEIALERLVEEEKQKLIENKLKENEKTTEQTFTI